MSNVIRLIAVVGVAVLLVSGSAYGASDKPAGMTVQNKATIVDVGNKTCPVTGDKVSGKDFYEYNGKRYGLCCPMCPATFAGDPEKYSAIADKEIAGK